MNAPYDAAEAVAEAERDVFRADFMHLASDPDSLALPCAFGRVVKDYRIDGSRHQTGGEVIADAVDDSNETPLAMGLLCRAALGQDVSEDARRLLARCAVKWAERRSEL
jgi:hypothetical protein